MLVSKEQWMDWRRNPVTQKYLADIMNQREGKKEEIAEGRVEGNELYLEIGRTQGIKDAVEYAIDKFDYTEIANHGTESSGISSDSEG